MKNKSYGRVTFFANLCEHIDFFPNKINREIVLN